jgi:hypothetical protein
MLGVAIYAAFLLYVYYYRINVPAWREAMRVWYHARGIGFLFNFMPLKNILRYVTHYYSYNTSILVYNLICPVLVYLPLGVYVSKCFCMAKSIRVNLCFLLFIICFMLPRPFLFIGHFDIDKVILAIAGFNAGRCCHAAINRHTSGRVYLQRHSAGATDSETLPVSRKHRSGGAVICRPRG